MMAPDRLVAIREYDYASLADDDLRCLADADIPAYLSDAYDPELPGRRHRHGGSVALRVPESAAERALSLLPEPPPRLLDPTARLEAQFKCPRCGSASSTPRRPYALIGFLVGVAAGVWFSAHDNVAAAVIAPIGAMVLGGLIESRIPKWRCNVCGKTWSNEGS